MGIAGTDVCKEAADIIIVNDNFERIVRAAKWGRNVYDNIQRFLRFQLTVNFVALFSTLIPAAWFEETPFTAIQLLWVNLIMDSLAALALATGSPKEELLERKPQKASDYLVSRRMVKHIMYGSIY
jgi:magnesium-transporting ATPase (P-type)